MKNLKILILLCGGALLGLMISDGLDFTENKADTLIMLGAYALPTLMGLLGIIKPPGASAKQSHLVIRIASRPFYPLAVVIIPSREGIADRTGSGGQDCFHLPPQFVVDPLIRVQDKDPVTRGLVN